MQCACPGAGLTRRPSCRVFLVLAGVACCIGFAPGTARAGGQAVQARHGMVVSVSPTGTDIGVRILRKGGNAVDAAVATAFALAVTWPSAGNIGGGGFLLLHPANKDKPAALDHPQTPPS